MKKSIALFFFCLLLANVFAQPSKKYNLNFDKIPTRWDDGLPLGNATIGALIWQKGDHLRMSLDNVYLWDDRPMPKIDQLKFDWVLKQIEKKDYGPVQVIGDDPYEDNPAPSKLPGAAIEINTQTFGKATSAVLDIETAIATITWENNIELESYVNATNNCGVFILKNTNGKIDLQLVPPTYANIKKTGKNNSVEGQGLQNLGYEQGIITKTKNRIEYFQKCHGQNAYKVIVELIYGNKEIKGLWTIEWMPDFTKNTKQVALDSKKDSHLAWWKNYWSKSAIQIPEDSIAKQYYLDMYKFGSAARANTPPITLQAVWTADNGSLPPWKGDIHNDLNTELSYWPGYTGNHLDLTEGFTNFLWNTKERNRKWTKQYFNKNGINVAGVETISGAPMGGWIQYAMSLTAGAWLSQHFYWQWKYGKDEAYLKKIVYPYFKELETFYSSMLIPVGNGKLTLPASSSPEIHNNDLAAWYPTITNYDLAMLKTFYKNCNEIYVLMNDKNADKLTQIQQKLPDFSVSDKGLKVSETEEFTISHRHLSPDMAIYPNQNLDIDNEKDKVIIKNSLRQIEKNGTREWCGYSFSWMANIYAVAKEPENAIDMLRKFTSNFVSINSFHLNGDQKGGQYSGFTYRPFTLEGNFAFAHGVHQLLLQSNNDKIEIFPAVPAAWKDVSFSTLRTEGGFLISAKKENGLITEFTITATHEGKANIKMPFKTFIANGINRNLVKLENGFANFNMAKNQTVVFKNGFE